MSVRIDNRPDLEFYELQKTLDGVPFNLVFRWNGRDETWYMSIYDPDTAAAADGSRTPIIGQIPILIGWPLLGIYQRRDRPLGDFVAIDTSGQNADPGRYDLGERVVLVYYTNDELRAL